MEKSNTFSSSAWIQAHAACGSVQFVVLQCGATLCFAFGLHASLIHHCGFLDLYYACMPPSRILNDRVDQTLQWESIEVETTANIISRPLFLC